MLCKPTLILLSALGFAGGVLCAPLPPWPTRPGLVAGAGSITAALRPGLRRTAGGASTNSADIMAGRTVAPGMTWGAATTDTVTDRPHAPGGT